jgi:hypothetical protein
MISATTFKTLLLFTRPPARMVDSVDPPGAPPIVLVGAPAIRSQSKCGGRGHEPTQLFLLFGRLQVLSGRSGHGPPG